MFKCKKHGISWIGKVCKKCEIEEKLKVYQPTYKKCNCVVEDDNTSEILVSAAILSSVLNDAEPKIEKSEDPNIFEGGSSGGGGAERSFEVSEPSKDSGTSFTSEESFSSSNEPTFNSSDSFSSSDSSFSSSSSD